jgi:DNA-directed RNA polymerase specialized sigma24 family protein
LEGLSIREIAQRLGVTEDTVDKRLKRALARLDRELGGHASDYLSG